MFDRYRIYIASFIAPIIGLLIIFSIWTHPSMQCSGSPECFGKLPISAVIIVTFLLYAAMFLTGIGQKARDHYEEDGLPFWKLARSSTHWALLATLEVTVIMLFSKWPARVNEMMDAVFVTLLPLLAVFTLYTTWYLIVGKQNKQIKFDAQKERNILA